MMAARTILFFFVLILLIRLMGKRQVGQMEPSEFVVAMLIANLATIPIENPGFSIRSGLYPMALIFAAERIISILSFRSIRLRRLLCGKPVILVENGKPISRNLRRTRVNLDELAGQIRQQGILELSQVQYAILETNGALAVIPFPQFCPASARDAGVEASAQELPYTVISEGRLLEENLILAGKSRHWLEGYLSGKGCTQNQVLLLTVTPSGKTALLRRSEC